MKEKTTLKAKLMIAGLMVANYILYMNYRVLFAFLFWMPVYDFTLFIKIKTDRELLAVMFFDAAMIVWFMFGFWVALATAAGILTLNSIVLLFVLIKKRRTFRKK